MAEAGHGVAQTIDHIVVDDRIAVEDRMTAEEADQETVEAILGTVTTREDEIEEEAVATLMDEATAAEEAMGTVPARKQENATIATSMVIFPEIVGQKGRNQNLENHPHKANRSLLHNFVNSK